MLRGKKDVIVTVLETLRGKYDVKECRSPATTHKQDIITGSSTLSKEDIITDWARAVVEHTGYFFTSQTALIKF